MSAKNGQGKFTPTQKRIMEILSDGEHHTIDELLVCLPDELGDKENVRPHLTYLRRVLRPMGRDIACEIRGIEPSRYRLIRLLAPAGDGKR